MRNSLNKRFAIVLVALLMLATATKAQVFIQDDEFEGVMRSGYEDFGLLVPIEGEDADQYLPLGEGLSVLVGLGGFYLLKKRKKDSKG